MKRENSRSNYGRNESYGSHYNNDRGFGYDREGEEDYDRRDRSYDDDRSWEGQRNQGRDSYMSRQDRGYDRCR